jgi:anti-sigma B factor antagonist
MEQPTFSVETRVTESGTVVGVAGEIDLQRADQLGAVLEAAFDGGAERIVVELSQVAFMDSLGLRCLVRAQRRHGPDSVVLAGVTGQVARVLETSEVAFPRSASPHP